MIVRYILTVLATVVLISLLHGQTTVEYTQTIRWNVYHNGQFYATASQGASIDLCLGETYEFIVGYSSGGFYSGTATDFFLLEEAYCNGGCINLGTPAPIVNFLGTSTTSVSYVEADPSLNRCYSSSEFKTTITADQSGNFDMSWQGIRNYRVPDEPNSCNPSLFPRTEIFNFSGSFYINVLSNYNPVLVAPTEVQPGESFVVELINCAPGVSYSIEELCSRVGPPYNGSWFNCGNSANPGIKSFTAPDYTTELNFRAYYRRNECQTNYDSTSMISVQVVEQPVENACSDDEIAMTESMLQDPQGIDDRSGPLGDYHDYPVSNFVCNTEVSGCTIEDVWEFLKSDVKYQAPNSEDFNNDSETPNYFEIDQVTPLANTAFQDCDIIYLQAPRQRTTALAAYSAMEALGHDPLNGPYIPQNLLEDLPIDFRDPIKIVIDEQCKCITNYTLEGHVLHPGKVRRCLFVDDCNNVIIETRGTGFTMYGSVYYLGVYPLGKHLSEENVSVGTETFNNVDQRLINDYNQ